MTDLPRAPHDDRPRSSDSLEDEVRWLRDAVQRLKEEVDALNWKLDRHQKRLECIEDHPPFPLDQPPRHYATETQSVSMARRKRLGHLG